MLTPRSICYIYISYRSGYIRIRPITTFTDGFALVSYSMGYIHPFSSIYLEPGYRGCSLSREAQTPSLATSSTLSRGNMKAFPDQLRDIISPLCPGAAPPSGAHPGDAKEASLSGVQSISAGSFRAQSSRRGSE